MFEAARLGVSHLRPVSFLQLLQLFSSRALRHRALALYPPQLCRVRLLHLVHTREVCRFRCRERFRTCPLQRSPVSRLHCLQLSLKRCILLPTRLQFSRVLCLCFSARLHRRMVRLELRLLPLTQPIGLPFR
ncbi:MAG: hypothetical protein SGPRY_003796 [Prymnesium sp.]